MTTIGTDDDDADEADDTLATAVEDVVLVNELSTDVTTLLLIACSTSHSYEARQHSTLRNFALPRPIIAKLGVVDYFVDPYFVLIRQFSLNLIGRGIPRI